MSAFRTVKDFDAVEKFYGGKQNPEDEFFINTLTREFNIPRDRVETFAKIFVENLNIQGFYPFRSCARNFPVVSRSISRNYSTR